MSDPQPANPAHRMAAQILETSAAGFAGLATGLLFERHPELARRYEPSGFSDWKSQFQRWTTELSAALDAAEPAVFISRMLWVKTAFQARATPVDDVYAGLECLQETLADNLPADSAEAATTFIDRALSAVRDADEQHASDEQLNAAALSYFQAFLEGEPRRAIDGVLDLAKDPDSIRRAYLDILLPAQREVGRLWHNGELSIAEEHVITATTLRVMTLLCERGRPNERSGKAVLLGCVAGNVHEIATRCIADFFEMAGWRPIYLGANVPAAEFARAVEFFTPDVLVLAANMDQHLKAVRTTIDAVRDQSSANNAALKIIVGGAAFDHAGDFWKTAGADGFAESIEDAEPLARELVSK